MVSIIDIYLYLYPQARLNTDIILSDDGHGLVLDYWNPALGPQPTQGQLDAARHAAAKAKGITTIKETRKSTLDRYQKYSTGIARTYLDNLFAAQKFLAADTSLMATGQTPEQYLSLLGVEIGMTAAQFANYIISENLRLTAPNQTIPSAYDVEREYLKAQVAAQSALTAEAVQAIVAGYIAFCQPVSGN